MAIKFRWLKTIGKKFIALKENLELRAEEREAKGFQAWIAIRSSYKTVTSVSPPIVQNWFMASCSNPWISF